MPSDSPYPDYSIAPATFGNVVLYYALAFGIAWLVWIPLALSSWSLLAIHLPGVLAWLAGVAPIFAGAFMLHHELGRAGLRQLLVRCGMWKFNAWWYVIAFGLPIVMILFNLGGYRLVGGRIYGAPPPAWPLGYLSSVPLLIPLALFEEAGWRGYASPRLQSLLGQWGGSLVLGGVWGIWHIPYYLIRGVSIFADFACPYLVLSLLFFVIGTTAFETLMTWLFRWTRGSLLFACIFHASNNAFANLAFVPTAQAERGLIFILSAVVGWGIVFVVLGTERRLLLRQQKAARGFGSVSEPGPRGE